MKTLYVTIWEFGAIQEATDRYRGNWGGFQRPAVAAHKALVEVLGAEIAERCIVRNAAGVRIEVVVGGMEIQLADRIQ